MAQVHVADAQALGALRLHGGGDGAVGGAPGDDEQIAVGIAGRNSVGNVLDDGFDLGSAQANHFFVVQRFVVHVAGDVLLFQAADAMFEAGRAGNGPGTRQGLRIALVGQEAFGIGDEFHRESWEVCRRSGIRHGSAPLAR